MRGKKREETKIKKRKKQISTKIPPSLHLQGGGRLTLYQTQSLPLASRPQISSDRLCWLLPRPDQLTGASLCPGLGGNRRKVRERKSEGGRKTLQSIMS